MSTARFLPTDWEKPEDSHWAIASDSKAPSHSLCIHANKLAGRSLVHAKTPWDLFIAVGYGMLGWLSMLKIRFLCRDINIDNVLMLDPPVTKLFRARTMEQLVTQVRFQDGGEHLAKYVNLLEQMIRDLGYWGKCHGFVTDCGTAVRLEDHLTSGNLREKSGTHKFISKNSLWDPNPHPHSPVDDLESFYYTAQWAAAFNDGAIGGKHDGDKIRRFRKMISGERRSSVILTALQNHLDVWEEEEEEYGAFFTKFMAILRPRLENLNTLNADH